MSDDKLYERVRTEYLFLIDTLWYINDSAFDGTPERFEGINRFTSKIIAHAATMYHLRSGSTYESHLFPPTKTIYDYMSLPILARSILDTYLYCWEIYIEPKDDAKSLWLKSAYYLRAFHIREKYKETFGSVDKKVLDKKIRDVQDLRYRVTNSAYYRLLPKKSQKKIKEQGGIFPQRSIFTKSKAVGYSEEFIQKNLTIFHDYVHGGGLSVAQTDSYNSIEEINKLFNLYQMFTCTVLARLIMDYVNSFPKARDLYNTIIQAEKTIIERFIAISSP